MTQIFVSYLLIKHLFTVSDLMLMSAGSSARMKEGCNNLLSAADTPMSDSGATDSNFSHTKLCRTGPIEDCKTPLK